MSYEMEEKTPPRHKKSRKLENVLVMQGGGSLGSFACGVFKALVKQKVRVDIVAGTSIGAINAAIIAGSKSDQPEKDLEEFWLELSESTIKLIPDLWMYGWDSYSKEYFIKKILSASVNAAIFGIPKMFIPRWQWWNSYGLLVLCCMIRPYYK
jgi:NTE family protein